MNLWLLLWSAVLILLFMSVAFLVARQRNRVDTVDAAWGLAFIIPAALAFGYQTQLQTIIIGFLVYLWAIRLSTHLIERNRTRPDDPRYHEFSKKWRGNFWLRAYFSVFLLQGVLVWIISLPVNLSGGKPLHYAMTTAVIGVAVWLVGFLIEASADRQLETFVRDKKHQGQTLQSGLWRYSRHPNYFGELTQWFGVAIVVTGVKGGWVGFVSPIFLSLLIVFVSGIPPIEKRRKDDKEYQSYKQRTSVLIPWFPRHNA